MATDIERIVGFSVNGYSNEIAPGNIQHIENEHGTNGRKDQSMQDHHDLARISFVIDNYEKISAGKISREYKNSDGTKAKTIILQKRIDNEFYYVVEAVPDANLKTLHIVSAYKNKKDTFSDVPVSNDPRRYVQDEHQPNVSNDIILNEEDIVKNNISDEAENYSGNGNLQSGAEGISLFSTDAERHHTTKAEQDYIEEICKALGRTVVFEHITAEKLKKIGEDTDGEIPDGYIDKKGVIHIGFVVSDPVNFIFKHELTHFGEGTVQYERFVKAVRGSSEYRKWLAEATNNKVNTDLEMLESEYIKIIRNGKGDMSEVYADFVGDRLFKDNGSGLEALISSIEKSDRPAFIQYILDFLAYLKKKLAGVENITFEISHLEDSFNRMLSEATRADENGTRKQSEVKNTFARSFNTEEISKAEEMEREGKSEEEIWYKTQHIRDNGGVWIYEIDDDKIKFRPEGDAQLLNEPEYEEFIKLQRKKRKSNSEKDKLIDMEYKFFFKYGYGQPYLKNFLKHDKLFEVYPQLKHVRIKFENLPKDEGLGYYAPHTNTIVIAKKLLTQDDNLYEARHVLIHEIQHAVQFLDKREIGSNVEFWNARLLSGKRMPKNRRTGEVMTPVQANAHTAGEVEAEVSANRMEYSEGARERLFPNFYKDVAIKISEYIADDVTVPSKSEYSQAVKNNDTKALQQMVDTAAMANGYTERLYHQTDADFTEFNTKNQRAGKYDFELPAGTFLKPSNEDIGLKGKKQMELYARLRNPLEFKDREDARSFWEKNVEGYKQAVEEVLKIDEEYRARTDEAMNNVRNFSKEWKQNNPEANNRKLYANVEYQRLMDIQDSIVDEWEEKSNEVSLKAKELINSFIAQNDYDGIIVENDVDGANKSTKTYIVFDSSQLKSAETVTYDDSGKVIPLSERFQSDEKDIRYSFPRNKIDRYSEEQYSIGSPMQQARDNLARYESGEITREEYLEENDKLWGEVNEKYGSIPEGENAQVNISVPQQVAENEPTERFIRTIIETGKLTPEMIEYMEQEILTGGFSYDVISDEKAMQKAEKIIKNGTAEDVWEDAVNNGKINKNVIAVGEQLLANAIEANDVYKVLTLSSELADVLTIAGQTVQAARLLKKMTGAGRLVSVQRTVKTLNKNLREKYGEDREPIKISPESAERLAKAKTKKGIEHAYTEILEEVANQMPVTWLDKWNAWRYFAMLSNPKTHIRNLVGNGIFVPVVRIKDFLATAIESGAAATGIIDKSDKTKVLKIKEEYAEFARNDSKRDDVKALLKGNKYNDKTALKEHQRTFKTEALEFITTFNSNLLEAEDMIFKNRHYRHALAGFLQARKVNLETVSEDVLMEARAYAVKEAKKATFNDESALANLLQKRTKDHPGVNIAIDIAVEGTLPFKRTPINIVKRGVEYGPIGLGKTLTKGVYDVKKGEITATEFIDGLASGLTGTGIMLAGMFLANLGLISGGEEDDKKSQFEKWLGKQEYSVEFFGMSYTIDWAAPACIPFFIGVEIVNTMQEGETFELSQISNAMWNSLEPITNLSMLSGIQGVIESTRGADKSQILSAIATDALTSYAMQGVPSLFGAVARTIDPAQRQWYADKNSKWFDAPTQTLINNVKSKVPGLSYTQPPKIDPWGREVSRGSVGERIVENFISPGYYSELDYNETSEELKRLFVKTGGNVFPKVADKSFEINGKTKYLTADEYVTYAKAKGSYSFEYIQELLNSKAYKGLTDDERADVIKNIYEFANAKAKATVSDYDPAEINLYKTVTRWERNGRSAVDYYIHNAISK